MQDSTRTTLPRPLAKIASVTAGLRWTALPAPKQTIVASTPNP
jgi:hypothetical protein